MEAFLTLTDTTDDEIQAQVEADSSAIDVSEFEDQDDKIFLLDHGREIIRIDAKAEAAKEKICKAIDKKADDAKGRHIYEIQERFRNNPELKGGLYRYFHSIGFWTSQMEKMGLEKPEKYITLSSAFHWANAYRAALEMQEKLAGLLTPEEIQEKAQSIPVDARSKILTACSEAKREEIYLDVAAGKTPTKREVNELVKTPEIKLDKAKESLEVAKARQADAQSRYEEVKADPEIPSLINGIANPEYEEVRNVANSANKSVANLEKKIADLQAQIEAKDSQLSKLQSDEGVIREQRMAKVKNTLIATLPTIQAELQRFYSEIEFYDSDTIGYIEEHLKLLNTYIESHL